MVFFYRGYLFGFSQHILVRTNGLLYEQGEISHHLNKGERGEGMKGKCKHEIDENTCRLGNLRFFNLLVCDHNVKSDCDDYEEQED
jgi:hypothetical protein